MNDDNKNNKPHDSEAHEDSSQATSQAMTQWLLDHDLAVAELSYAASIHQRVLSDASFAQYVREIQTVRVGLEHHVQPVTSPLGGESQWAAHLQQVIRDAAEADDKTNDETDDKPYKSAPQRSRNFTWFWAGAAGAAGATLVAAMLIIAVTLGGYTSNPSQTHEPSLVTAASNRTAHFLPDAPQQTRQTLRELWQFYDGQANWVAMTGSDVRLGLSSHPIPMTEMVVVSLSLTGPAGQIFKTDIALVPGQDVDLVVPRDQDKSLRYQLKVIHEKQAGDTPTIMSLKLTATMDDGVSMTTTFPLGEASVKEVGRLLTARGDYQLHLGMASTASATLQDTVQ